MVDLIDSRLQILGHTYLPISINNLFGVKHLSDDEVNCVARRDKLNIVVNVEEIANFILARMSWVFHHGHGSLESTQQADGRGCAFQVLCSVTWFVHQKGNHVFRDVSSLLNCYPSFPDCLLDLAVLIIESFR